MRVHRPHKRLDLFCIPQHVQQGLVPRHIRQTLLRRGHRLGILLLAHLGLNISVYAGAGS